MRRTLAHIAAALICFAAVGARAQNAGAQDNAGQGDQQWSDGTWVGDEGAWDEPPPPPDNAQMPSDNGDAMGNYDSSGQPAADSSGYQAQYQGSYNDSHAAAVANYTDGYQDGYADGQTAGPSIDDFHSSLDSQGEWIDTPEYGRVWRPTQVDSQWQPYSDGQWSYTEAGWYWNGAEPWGWAVYHYGRWAFYSGRWFWVPGRIWAPSWVSWRWGGRYAGWAPLGPRGSVWGSPRAWVVVEQAHFLEPARQHAQPIAIRQTFMQRTQPFPVIRPGPRTGPVVRNVSVATGTLVSPSRLQPVRSASQAAYGGHGLVVNVYRPQTRPIVGVPTNSRLHNNMRPAGTIQRPGAPVLAQPTAPRAVAPEEPRSHPDFEGMRGQRPEPVRGDGRAENSRAENSHAENSGEANEVFQEHTPSRGKVIEFEAQRPQPEETRGRQNVSPPERNRSFSQPVQPSQPRETRQDRFEREERQRVQGEEGQPRGEANRGGHENNGARGGEKNNKAEAKPAPKPVVHPKEK